MTYQKSILKPGLKKDVDALDTWAQLTAQASKVSHETNYSTFTFPWAQPFPKTIQSKSHMLGFQPLLLAPTFTFRPEL